MITIEQLLDSVDLDFEPRWVTKDEDGDIYIWADKPEIENHVWDAPLKIPGVGFGAIKLTEFQNKDWKVCIYEVPRKTNKYELFLKKLGQEESDLVYRVNVPRKTTGKIEKIDLSMPNNKMLTDLELIEIKINDLVDAVNELKGV